MSFLDEAFSFCLVSSFSQVMVSEFWGIVGQTFFFGLECYDLSFNLGDGVFVWLFHWVGGVGSGHDSAGAKEVSGVWGGGDEVRFDSFEEF